MHVVGWADGYGRLGNLLPPPALQLGRKTRDAIAQKDVMSVPQSWFPWFAMSCNSNSHCSPLCCAKPALVIACELEEVFRSKI